MKAGDLVKWTIAKTSPTINPYNNYHIGILLYPEVVPNGSWTVKLSKDGSEVHGDITEIEVISECRLSYWNTVEGRYRLLWKQNRRTYRFSFRT